MAHPTALLLNAEIAAVVTSMRQNAKWALVPMRYTHDDDTGDDPLLEDFRLLRRRIFKWQDWAAVEPLEYMAPFLEVVRSPETSGPITGVALTSVRRMLNQNVIGASRHGVADAMYATADAITQCKFEATDPASDEVVLYKILQVLSSCVRCPGGAHLTNGNVIDIFHACFRIGHYQTERSKDMSELLTQASRQIMLELVDTIFRHLSELPAVPLSPGAVHSMAASRIPASPLSAELGSSAAADAPADGPLRLGSTPSTAQSRPVAADAAAPAADEQPAQEATSGVGDGGEAGGASAPVGRSNSSRTAAPGLQQPQSPVASQSSVTGAPSSAALHEGSGTKAAVHDWTGAHHTVSVAPPAAIRLRPPDSVVDPAVDEERGLDSVAEILGYLISLVASETDGVHTDLNEFGLELMNVALNAGGAAYERHEGLMAMLQEDLFVALSVAVRAPNLACLSGACQVTLTLYCHLGKHLLLQLEAFISSILLKLAEGKGIVKIEQQEAALEGVLDFCNQLSFIRNIYLNLDCRMERGNLFEAVTTLLSKTAFPVNSPLGSVHLLSLEGLFSILSALSASCKGVSSWDAETETAVQPVSPEQLRAVWAALVNGRLVSLPAEANGGGAADSELATAARVEKQVKQRLIVAADHFNRDYRKGFQYLQAMGLMGEKLEAGGVARFLRHCPGLSKTTIGELLGEPSDFWVSVLTHFVDTFDFSGLDFDSSLRMFLQGFRLPGEAQKIARVLETFSNAYHMQCPGTFKNSDAAYVLSYSVILLNTDQHNKQVKKKMTLEQFIRNNRGINDGENLPDDFLTVIYNSINRNEIKLSSEASAVTLEVSPVLWTELGRASHAPRGSMIQVPWEGTMRLERDMFLLLWGPVVAAVSVVLDHADSGPIVFTALGGLLHAARIAAFHHVDEVMDNLVASLSRYTQLLNPASSKPAIAFGESEKARFAADAVFTIATRYGDSLRAGWRDVMEFVTRLHKLGFLPLSLLAVDGETGDAAAARLPKATAPNRSSSSSSLFSRAFNSLISVDGSEASGPEVSEREATATARTMECIRACNLADVFRDCTCAEFFLMSCHTESGAG